MMMILPYILGRYPGFYRKLLTSPSKEVRILAKMVSGDPRSTTCRNIRYMREISNLDTVFTTLHGVKKVPEKEKWRLGLLNTLMGMQSERFRMVQDSKRICAMIDSLCSTQMIPLPAPQGDPNTHTIWGPVSGSLTWSSIHLIFQSMELIIMFE